MGMRRANDLAVKRARRSEIGAVHRAPGHLRHTVGTDRPRPHPLEPFRRYVVHRCLRRRVVPAELRLPWRGARSKAKPSVHRTPPMKVIAKSTRPEVRYAVAGR